MVKSIANRLAASCLTVTPTRAAAQVRPRWYVVQTKARAEQRAVEFLMRKAVSTFVPRLLVRHRHGSRRWNALEPLFPGYLFAHFVPVPHALNRVRWTPGVWRLLGDESAPVPIADEIVRYLQEREGERGYILPGQPITAGVRVRFRCGPFELLEGVIERPASRADRVRVLLMLVSTPVTVEAGIEDLERV